MQKINQIFILISTIITIGILSWLLFTHSSESEIRFFQYSLERLALISCFLFVLILFVFLFVFQNKSRIINFFNFFWGFKSLTQISLVFFLFSAFIFGGSNFNLFGALDTLLQHLNPVWVFLICISSEVLILKLITENHSTIDVTSEQRIKEYFQKHKLLFWILLVISSVLFRFVAMSFGNNCDFTNFYNSASIAAKFQNIYINTIYYNYGPILYFIIGAFYRISLFFQNSELAFRFLWVLSLSFTDIGIALLLAHKYSNKVALLFLLNPVSIFITGFHNQFDNMAVFFAIFASFFFNKSEKFSLKDFYFILLISISIDLKHLFFFIPIWTFFVKGLPWKKRFFYSGAPILLFFLSFVPFIIDDQSAFTGIMNNVFLYRSFNNSPLFYLLFNSINLPENYFFFVFIIILFIIGLLVNQEKYTDIVLIYSISLVAFSSALTNEYLVIPMAALCIYSGKLKYLYMGFVTYFFMFNYDGLNLRFLPFSKIFGSIDVYNNGYRIAVLFLVMILGKVIIELVASRKNIVISDRLRKILSYI